MRLFSSLAAAVALCVSGFSAHKAEAATMDFVVDLANSSVTVTETGGGGLACWLTNCGVQADLALTDGATYTLSTGVTETFDFLTFSGDGTTGITPRSFDISAVLAFSTPDLDVNGSGSGAAFMLAGYITAGVLTWTSISPSPWISPVNGSEISFLFEGGSGIFLGNTVTTSASIIGTSVVPLPAGGLLLIGALGGLAALRRRKAAA